VALSTATLHSGQPVPMGASTIEGVVLDHVAHAVPRWQEVWARYATDLGAQWTSGGLSSGFAPAQLRFGNGAKLEILMPNAVDLNDFLDRFLAHSGPGPHHLTFKVPDLDSAFARVREAGYEPIGINLSDPEWMEGFIHPRQATGVVVQLAQALNDWGSPPPDDFPSERRLKKDGRTPAPPASLLWVVHAVAVMAEARSLFVDVLGGRIVGNGLDDFGHDVLDLSWGGPLGLRLVASTAVADDPMRSWVGNRKGRIHHLALTAEEAEELPGSRPVVPPSPVGSSGARPGTFHEIPLDMNAGMRLIVGPADGQTD
jgi:catechol 2,3-dioxygenase-like lactoylglutathione lyase family enzyme